MARLAVMLICVICLAVLAAGPALAARALTAEELASTEGGQLGHKCVKVGCAGTAMGCCMAGVGDCDDHGQCSAQFSDCVEIDLNEDLGECRTGEPLEACWEISLWCIKYKGGEDFGPICTCNQTCQTTEDEDACIVPVDPPGP